MDFVVLKTSKEEQYIKKDQIGRLSIIQNRCDKCGIDHYVLEIYDNKDCLLCSITDTRKAEIDRLRGEICDEKGTIK